MDFSLNPERRAMVDSVRQLAQGEFKADGLKYMDGSFPGRTSGSWPTWACWACRCPRNTAASACPSSTPR